jgi:hypothetical protein
MESSGGPGESENSDSHIAGDLANISNHQCDQISVIVKRSYSAIINNHHRWLCHPSSILRVVGETGRPKRRSTSSERHVLKSEVSKTLWSSYSVGKEMLLLNMRLLNSNTRVVYRQHVIPALTLVAHDP